MKIRKYGLYALTQNGMVQVGYLPNHDHDAAEPFQRGHFYKQQQGRFVEAHRPRQEDAALRRAQHSRQKS